MNTGYHRYTLSRVLTKASVLSLDDCFKTAGKKNSELPRDMDENYMEEKRTKLVS